MGVSVAPRLGSLAAFALRTRGLSDAAQKAAERAARLAIENAKRSAGELAAAERAVAEAPSSLKSSCSHGAPSNAPPRAPPRFPIGARVECRLGEEKWAFGFVIGHFYREPSWAPDRRVPYQAAARVIKAMRLRISRSASCWV